MASKDGGSSQKKDQDHLRIHQATSDTSEERGSAANGQRLAKLFKTMVHKAHSPETNRSRSRTAAPLASSRSMKQRERTPEFGVAKLQINHCLRQTGGAKNAEHDANKIGLELAAKWTPTDLVQEC